MRCPFCQNEDTQVKDSRPTEDGAAIRRRRLCPECGGRFTTFERVQLRELTILKRSGRRVALRAREAGALDRGGHPQASDRPGAGRADGLRHRPSAGEHGRDRDAVQEPSARW